MNNLFEVFHRHFSVIPANSPDLQDQAHAIRYQVYCVENAFEDPQQHPSGRERDHYDDRAIQSLVLHPESKHYIGAVRLIMADPDNHEAPFPVEVRCQQSFVDPEALNFLPRHSVAEISRFAVSKGFKRSILEYGAIRETDNSIVADAKGEGAFPALMGQQLLPLATLGLFAGIVRMSAENGITHWFAAMQPTLLRLLSRFGIYFQVLGPVVDYHGQRQPVIGVIDEVLAGIYRERRDVWELITDFGRIWPLNEVIAAQATSDSITEPRVSHRA
jgi:N-acyl amino acid synthase of PEP-CTERM/exosortase system